jgi:Outer membrane cobalamin receptor protein
MKKTITTLFVAILLTPPTVYAQTIVQDSVALDNVIVTGSRAAVNPANLPMSVSVVNEKTIEGRFEQSILPIITEEVPGMFVTSRGIMGYGVSSGSAGGMNIRGVGGGSQLLVLIDGHPQYMGLMGHPLADAYQSLMTERVEVVRGPASVLYGSNAMNGVINIITKKQRRDGVHTGIKTMYGSYNTVSTEIHNSVRSGKFNSFVSLGYNSTDGHRDDIGFKQYSGYAKLGYDFSPHWNSFVDLSLTNFDASNPGAINSPILDNDADITRGVASFSLENNYENTFGALKMFYNFGSHEINDGYSVGGTANDYRFRSNDRMLGASLYQTYRLFEGNQTTAGVDFQHAGGKAWNKFVNGNPDAQIAKEGINEFAGYINIQQSLFDKLTFNAGIRVDHHNVSGTEFIPQIGLSWFATESTVVKGIVSKGFRNPNIREMYMFPPQNPDLKPERLMNYEASVSQKLLNGALDFDMSIYYIKGDNMIQTIRNNGVPLNINVGKIENHGLEFSTNYLINKNLRLSANYSYLNMEHKVLAAPAHKAYASINYSERKWSFSTGLQYIDGLYTVLPNDSGVNGVKENFALWNVRAAYRPISSIEVFVKGENLLAQKYEINNGYPMPRATVFGGLNLRL